MAAVAKQSTHNKTAPYQAFDIGRNSWGSDDEYSSTQATTKAPDI